MLKAEVFAQLDEAYLSLGSPGEAFTLTCQLAKDFGFEHVIHAPVRNHPNATKNWSATTYPSEWQKLYAAKAYLSRNPVRRHAEISSTPFLWSALEKSLPASECELFRDCRDCGMTDGFVVPVRGAWGQVVAIGFACQSLEAMDNPGKSGLILLAYKLHHHFDRLKSPARQQITAREVQVLEQLAQGRNNPEIADRLAISDNAVEWHLKNIYRKLEVANRTSAVIKAIQNGILEL